MEEEEKLKSCKCSKDSAEIENENKMNIIEIIAGSVLFAISLIFKMPDTAKTVLCVVSYFILGTEIIIEAVKNLFKGNFFDENFLMSIATFGAISIGYYSEAAAVMLFYRIGEWFEDMAVDRSKRSITELMDIRSDYANVFYDGDIKKVNPEEVKKGDIIVVKPGEKVPLDGIIIEGKSFMDTAALTGESVLREVSEGQQVLSGTINKDGFIKIRVTKEFGESTVSKILELVSSSAERKTKTENFITKFAKIYTPIVVSLAVICALIPPLVIPGAKFSEWLYKAIIFLVISCPCAFVISVPLGFFAGIGSASKRGILVKGGNYLEALANVKIAVFDKTGTLTKGTFNVTDIKVSGSLSKEEIVRFASYAESLSNHPIAKSIVRYFNEKIDKSKIKNYEEIEGMGIKAEVDGNEVLVGNARLMKKENIDFEEADALGSILYESVNGKYAGAVIVSDEIKEDSCDTLKELKNLGIRKTVMLTGDNEKQASKAAEKLGVDKYYSELLPYNKVEILEKLLKDKNKNETLLFAGDGINDAPVLARADIGIAMGGVGSDAAVEAADAVIMHDQPKKIVTAIKIARKTRRVVAENISFALAVKIIVLVLGILGAAKIWEAVFADVGVTFIAVLNSLRAMNIKE